MEKEKLLLDCDECICDPGLLYLMNKFLNTKHTYDEIKEYYMEDCIREFDDEKVREEFYEWLQDYNMYEYATIFPYAIEVMKLLNELYDLYILSACVNPYFVSKSGKQFADKYNFLIKNFPFLDPNKFIFTNSKDITWGSIRIDDRVNNLLVGNTPMKVLFTSYHNQNYTQEELDKLGIIRVGKTRDNGWLDIKKLLIDNKR